MEIISRLKHLEELKLTEITSNTISQVSELSKLKNLQKLTLEFYEDDDTILASSSRSLNKSLRLIKSNTLSYLNLKCHSYTLSDSTLAHLGKNLPHLTRLFIVSGFFRHNQLNQIIQSFPNLEEVRVSQHNIWIFETYTFPRGLEHENLKKLTLEMGTTGGNDFPKLVGCLKKLESLHIEICDRVTTAYVNALIDNLKEQGGCLNYF